MKKLSIDNNGTQVPVAELELISAKEQLVIGNLDRDLILRTAGNIKIQIRNKFYDFPISTDDSSGNAVLGGAIIVATDEDLALLPYPGDGQLIYVSETKAFYIATGGEYVLINKVDDTGPVQKVYLSFDEDQSLDGTQKFRVMMNAGLIVTSLDELGSYINPANAYAGQVVYSITDQGHYRLNDISQPALKASWQPTYITTIGGGIAKGGITIAPDGTGKQDALLHLVGNNDATLFNPSLLFSNTMLLASSDLLKGTAWWYDSLGGNYIESLSSIQSKGFNFISSQIPVLTLTAAGSSVYGAPNFNYGLTVNRTTLFNQLVYNNQGYKSTNFVQGRVNGVGYSLEKDNTNLWVFEVDKLIVRQPDSDIAATLKYETKSVNGAYWSPTEIVITEATLDDELQVFIIPSAAGSYTFDGINYIPRPLSDKLQYANVTFTIPGVGDDEDTTVTLNTLLLYGIGDRDAAGTLYSGPVTYVLDDEGNYHLPPPTHYFDGVEWVEDETLGTHVLSETISVYKILTTADSRVDKGDLLFYGSWLADEFNSKTIVAYVQDKTVDETTLWSFNGEVKQGDRLITVGNSITPKPSFQINGVDLHSDFIQVYDNIASFREMFEDIHYTDAAIDGRVVSRNFIFKANPSTSIGNLYGQVDTDLALTGITQQGLYSRNAYIEGNFVGNRVVFGIELTYIGGILTIKDLETIKSRNITGGGILGGGGNLFAGDIIITHDNGTWVNKPNLTGNNIISNLTVDQWGHVTDWTTRGIGTGDIPETGGNFYLNATNVQAITDPLYLKLTYAPLQTVTGLVKYNQPVKGVPAVASDEFVTLSQLTVSASDYVINRPLSGVQDGSNQTFTLPEPVVANTVQLYINGVRQAVGIDYTELSDTIIELTLAPLASAHMVADYRKA